MIVLQVMPFPSALRLFCRKKALRKTPKGGGNLIMKLFRKAKKPKQREFHVNWDTLEVKQGKRR